MAKKLKDYKTTTEQPVFTKNKSKLHKKMAKTGKNLTFNE